jgi:hypothetical protein
MAIAIFSFGASLFAITGAALAEGFQPLIFASYFVSAISALSAACIAHDKDKKPKS